MKMVSRFLQARGVEKMNDVVRAVYHRKSNKHDACKDTLLALKRIDILKDYRKHPNIYTKNNQEYWTHGILEQRRKRQRLCGKT